MGFPVITFAGDSVTAWVRIPPRSSRLLSAVCGAAAPGDIVTRPRRDETVTMAGRGRDDLSPCGMFRVMSRVTVIG